MKGDNRHNAAKALRSTARNNFRHNLSRLMHEQGLRKADLARKVGRADSQVKRWLDGKNEPDFETKDMIANVFDVSVAYLFRDLQTAS